MTSLLLIGLLGGLVTGISPCVLPLLPVVFFAGAGGITPMSGGHDSPSAPVGGSWWRRHRRPLFVVAGLALSFAVFTLIGSLLLSALGLPNGLVRWSGLALLALVGVGLLVPSVETVMARPFARFPAMGRAARMRATEGHPFLLGLGLGALYIPCAGPVLAAIAIAGVSGTIDARIVVLTASFAVGTAIPLLFFAVAGQRVGVRVAAFRRRARGLRIAGGIIMVTASVALALGATDAFQRWIPDYTAGLQADPAVVAQVVRPTAASAATVPSVPGTRDPQATIADCEPASPSLAWCGHVPTVAGIEHWFNTPGESPLDATALRGKVVLVTFWTYSCINCQRALPHVESWYRTYADSGLVVIGVHTPEFAFEHDLDNIRQGVGDQHLSFPVAVDNEGTTWRNFGNRFWPAQFLVDADGEVRHVKYGEGDYSRSEAQIRELLTVARPSTVLPAPVESGPVG